MPYSHGQKWTPELIDELRELKIEGHTVIQISEILSLKYNKFFSPSAAENALHRYCLEGSRLLETDTKIKTYKELHLPLENYMISCDYQSPYHSELWLNRLLVIADKFKIRKHIIVGDFLDFNFIKRFYSQEPRDLDKEIEHASPVMKALDYFDENILLTGNHERRIGIQTSERLQAKHLFGLFGADVWERKFKYSIYDRLMIGDEWMCVHPKSYSQVSGSTAVRLAEKYHRHIINAHGHFVALRFDRSGNYMAIDLGGIFDPSKIDYINLETTTHPFWENGFLMLLNGHAYHFHDGTDWKYWLGRKFA
jgi:hypothetical protein